MTTAKPPACESCGAPDRKVVLRQCGWWTEPTLEATVWATGGRFTYEPGTRIERGGAVIETIPERQFIHLPWRHIAVTEGVVCFTNTGQNRWVTIRLVRFEGRGICQWCRFSRDIRFRHQIRGAA